MIKGSDIRNGHLLKYNGQLWVVVKFMAVKPGKGGAYAQVELKNFKTSSKQNVRFRSDETVENVDVFLIDAKYSYKDNLSYYFSRLDNYELAPVDKDLISEEQSKFLQEELSVKLQEYEDQIIGVVLPEVLTVEVASAEPVIKGQTAAPSFKKVVLTNGVEIQVPTYVESGMKIEIRWQDLEFVRRSAN